MPDVDIPREELQVLVQYELIAALQEREHDLAEAQRLARLGSWTWDLTSDVVTWSDELYRVFVVDKAEFTPNLEGFLSVVHLDDRARVEATVRSALETHEPYVLEHRIDADDSRWVRSAGELDVASDGTAIRLHGTAQDITEEVAARTALATRSRHHAALMLDAAGRSVTVYEADGGVGFSTTSPPLLALGPSEVQDPTALDFIHDDDVDRVRRELLKLYSTPGARARIRFRVTDAGGVRDLELRAINATDDTAVGGTLISLDERDGARGQHHPDASPAARDWLTGLANHAVLLDFGRSAMARAARHGWSTAVLVIDVDDFHGLNERHGDEVGDEVLVELALRFASMARVSDMLGRAERPIDGDGSVARVGGDRFVAVYENVADSDAALKVADRVRRLAGQPIVLSSGGSLSVTVGVGVAIAGPSGRTVEQRIRDAEDAVRGAKQTGINACQVVAEGVVSDQQTRRDAERALEQAIERGEFVLHYQPKVSLESDRIIGAEALLRWQDPLRGMVPPLEFIPLAEETGLIIPIGVWVIEQACMQVAQWHRRFPRRPPLIIAVNVAARQFGPDLVTVVADALAASGAAPGQLCLEVTESTLIGDVDGTVETLRQLAALGVKLSIDDFGTGYSSLAYLKRLPLHELKIDKTFVDGLGEDADDTAIVAATVALAHALDLSVVAEGVETADQFDRLKVIGCQEVQGYHVSRPRPADGFAEFLVAEEGSDWRAAAERAPAAPADRYRPSRVLIVDDTADVRQLARMSLASNGFEVQEASSGSEGIALAQQFQPDCVILDVQMPDMSGMEVCRVLRADPRTAGCTILMLTSSTGADQKVEAFSSGADDYVIKPFSPRDLVGRVRAALGRHEGGDQR